MEKKSQKTKQLLDTMNEVMEDVSSRIRVLEEQSLRLTQEYARVQAELNALLEEEKKMVQSLEILTGKKLVNSETADSAEQSKEEKNTNREALNWNEVLSQLLKEIQLVSDEANKNQKKANSPYNPHNPYNRFFYLL